MTQKSYQHDNQLNILVLGAMTDHTDTPNRNIGAAIEELLPETDIKELLRLSNTTDTVVHVPDNFSDAMIVSGVLSKLDIADLVVVNLTPSGGVDGMPSPNVYYELGLVHALGIPYLLLAQKGSKKAFYTNMNKVIRVDDYNKETIKNVLRPHLLKFLDLNDDTDFAENEVSRYYDGMPIVDISAAVGLATGYYYNFVSRLIREGSFIKDHPKLIRKVLIVRPMNVLHTYEQDLEELKKVVSAAGYKLENKKLDPGDGKNAIFFDHVNGVILDIPRTIYPLQISPRILSMQEKFNRTAKSETAKKFRDKMIVQTSERLLDRIEYTLKYHISKDREKLRDSILHFVTIEEVPDLLKQWA